MDVIKTPFLRRSKASDKFPPFSFLIANRSVIANDSQLQELKRKTRANTTRILKEVNHVLQVLCA
jgi:hypothetical protein